MDTQHPTDKAREGEVIPPSQVGAPSPDVDPEWPWPQYPKKAKRNYIDRGLGRLEGWEGDFLDAFSKSGLILNACQAAHVSYTVPYNRKRNDPDFRAAYEIALEMAADRIENAAIMRAVQGVKRIKKHYYKGKEIEGSQEEIVEYSDALLQTILKGIRPAKYRETVNHNMNVTVALDEARQMALEKGLDPDLVIARAKEYLQME